MYFKWMKWFNYWWYKYLFTFNRYSGMDDASFIEKVICIWCRIKGHPKGPIWFTSGFDPDMQCKDCGEDLG